MNDKLLPKFSAEGPATGGFANAYLLHALVHDVSAHNNPPDEVLLGKLVRRRLSRLERALASYGGNILRQVPQGLLAAFDTAEAAVLVACEMQRRCAAIPQIAETQIGLKIGIHPAASGQNKSADPGAAEMAASRLAELLGDGSIVASGKVVEALPEILRENTSALCRENIGVAAHLVDWGAIPMRPVAPPPRHQTPAKTAAAPTVTLVLRHDGQSYRIGGGKSLITIGRDPVNDVVISDPNASRQHCRIIYRLGNHVLVDLSMNGTYVKSGDAPEQIVRKSMVTLNGSGQLSFGHSCRKNGKHVFEFEIS